MIKIPNEQLFRKLEEQLENIIFTKIINSRKSIKDVKCYIEKNQKYKHLPFLRNKITMLEIIFSESEYLMEILNGEEKIEDLIKQDEVKINSTIDYIYKLDYDKLKLTYK